MTEAQHNDLPEDEEITAADRLIIDSPTATGLIVLKALAPEPGLMPQAQTSLAASSCSEQTARQAVDEARACRMTRSSHFSCRCAKPPSRSNVRLISGIAHEQTRPVGRLIRIVFVTPRAPPVPLIA
jgi:hypothetical protein